MSDHEWGVRITDGTVIPALTEAIARVNATHPLVVVRWDGDGWVTP